MLGCAGHAWAQKPQPTVLTNAQLKALLSKGPSVKITGSRPPEHRGPHGHRCLSKGRNSALQRRRRHDHAHRLLADPGRQVLHKYTSNLGSGCFNVQKIGESTYKLIALDGCSKRRGTS